MANSISDSKLDDTVFLLDTDTKIERLILEKYIADTYGAGFDERIIFMRLRAESAVNKNAQAISTAIASGNDYYLVPLRVVWEAPARSSNKKRRPTIKGFIFGDSDKPSKRRQRALLKANKTEAPTYQVIEGRGASVAELQARLQQKSIDISLEQFVVRAAILTLERMERSIKGARYKMPRMVADEVLSSPQMKQVLAQLHDQTGTSQSELYQEAADCLKEMAATPTPSGLDLVAALGRYMYTQGFDEELDFAPGDIDRVRALLDERPVAFVFTHKSHIDGFLLYSVFHELSFPPVHTFGGINMGFMGLGTMLRNAGAIFIRRSFQGEEVYKAVFKNYIDYLGKKRFPVMWALEGTRSRTGKLMPPRFGLINYVIDAYLRDDAPDLVIMPISIVYDQIPEVGDYDALQAGGKKRPESALWFMEYLSGLKHPHGKIYVRFGEGVEIAKHINTGEAVAKVDRKEMQKLAFELAVDVNNVTPITVNSLICYVLLEQGHRAITQQQLRGDIQKLLDFRTLFSFPVTPNVEQLSPAILEQSLALLASNGVIDIAEDGIEVLYMIPYGTARTAAYYRNGLVQFYISSAVADLALLAVSDTGDKAIEQFQQAALRIRDLLKYEFFFEGSDEFLLLLERQLERRAPNWRDHIVQGKDGAHRLLRSMDLLLGQGTLRPFIEAYWVFAKALSLLPDNADVEPTELVNQCLALGKQGVLQQRIHCEESVSQAYFENGVKIAEGRGLFDKTAEANAGRKALLQELQDIVANIRFLSSLVENKRLVETATL